jgi:AhpD family alkylhydroperoxidase
MMVSLQVLRWWFYRHAPANLISSEYTTQEIPVSQTPAKAENPAKADTPKPDGDVPKQAASGTAAKSARDDDTIITALELADAEMTPAMRAYFDKCTEKLGFVPNVLKAYAFDMPKLEAFVAMYNDLMLAPSGLSKLEREMIAVAVSSQNRCYYCLTAHGAAVRALSDDPVLGFCHQADRRTLGCRGR